MKPRTEPALHSIIRAQMWLHKVAKRMRIPIAVRRAMVDVIDHAWREVYARNRKKKRA